MNTLSSFNAAERRLALEERLAANPGAPACTTDHNMHMHTFFSYNGEGWSPTELVWRCREAGLYSMAICDFDVLQGLEEVFAAADAAQVRCAAGFESRVFFREYANKQINSPGEPGVFYFMGMGFVQPPTPGTKAAAVLADMLERSHSRNRAVIDRINSALGDLSLDYDADVLPLTPLKNATERHIVRAYHDKAISDFGDTEKAAAFWAKAFDRDLAETNELMGNTNKFVDMLRSKLMKAGGLGYQQPGEDTFPLLDDVIGMIQECRAIPMSAWLDGSTDGEANPEAQLECLVSKGIEAVNIIPDRNWNFDDAAKAAEKVAALDRYVAAAKALNLPINIGTELNKPGQRFVDDFNAAPMAKHAAEFLAGAQVMVGHTRLLRWADFSFIDAAAANEFPTRTERNAFFASVGALPCPNTKTIAELEALSSEQAFTRLADAARKAAW